MATVEEIINARASQYTSDPRIVTLQEIAENQTNQGVMGVHYENAVALRVLHMLELSDRASSGGANSGSVASLKEGQLSKSFHGMTVQKGDNSNLTQTSWGLELLDLMESVTVPFGNRMTQ